MSTISGGIGPKQPLHDVAPMAPTAPTTKTSESSGIKAPKSTPKVETTPDKSESSVVESSLGSTSSSAIATKAKKVDLLSMMMSAGGSKKITQDKANTILKAPTLTEQLKNFKTFISKQFSGKSIGESVAKAKGMTLLTRKFHPEASPREKMISEAFRTFMIQDQSYENAAFIDSMVRLSDLEPDSPKLKPSIDKLYHTYIKEDAQKTVNIEHGSRSRAIDAYSSYQEALENYAADPSPENLTAVQEARTEVVYSFQSCYGEIKKGLDDVKARFIKSDILKDVQALTSSEHMHTGRGLKKAAFIDSYMKSITQDLGSESEIKERIGLFEHALELYENAHAGVESFTADDRDMQIQPHQSLMSSLSELKDTISSWIQTPLKSLSGSFEVKGFLSSIFNPTSSSTDKQTSAAFRAFLEQSSSQENMLFIDRVTELSTLEPGPEMDALLQSIYDVNVMGYESINLAGINLASHPLREAFTSYFDAQTALQDNPCPETREALDDARAELIGQLKNSLDGVAGTTRERVTQFIPPGDKERDKSLTVLCDLDFIQSRDLRTGQNNSHKRAYLESLKTDKFDRTLSPKKYAARVSEFEKTLASYTQWMNKAV